MNNVEISEFSYMKTTLFMKIDESVNPKEFFLEEIFQKNLKRNNLLRVSVI